MKPNLKKTLKYLLSALLAVVLLWFAFRGVDWDKFWIALAEVNWRYVIFSMVTGSAAFWIRALRWRRLLLPLDDSISRTTVFNGINIGNISNFIFPRLGEFIRCGVIVRRSQPVDPSEPLRKKAPYGKVLGTVVMERAWELVVMLLLLAVVVVCGFDRYGPFVVEKIWRPMLEKFGPNMWFAVLGALSLLAVVLFGIWKQRKTNLFCRKIWSIFQGIGQGFATCMQMDRKWLFFAYTLLIWIMYWLMAAGTMWAVPFLDHLNFVDALFLSLVGGLGFFVPVPGGIGAFHYVISIALLGVYGVPIEIGLIYATLSHTSQAITQILFGAGSYAYEALKK
jgi:uncharacterized membrane protein YbhN (UPF0104 family)